MCERDYESHVLVIYLVMCDMSCLFYDVMCRCVMPYPPDCGFTLRRVLRRYALAIALSRVGDALPHITAAHNDTIARVQDQ